MSTDNNFAPNEEELVILTSIAKHFWDTWNSYITTGDDSDEPDEFGMYPIDYLFTEKSKNKELMNLYNHIRLVFPNDIVIHKGKIYHLSQEEYIHHMDTQMSIPSPEHRQSSEYKKEIESLLKRIKNGETNIDPLEQYRTLFVTPPPTAKNILLN